MDFTLGYLREAISNYDEHPIVHTLNQKLKKGNFQTEGEFIRILNDEEIKFLNNVLPDEIRYAFNEQDYIRGNQLNEVYEMLI